MSKRIGVTFDDATYQQIRQLAHKEGTDMSRLVREWSIEHLNGEVNKNNIDMITQIIREQVRDVMKPSVERLATLSSKTCVQASTSAYLTAECIAKLVPLDLQQDLQEVYETARKKGVAYTKQRATLSDDE